MTAPYAGAPVSQTFRERWLSGSMIGDSAPVQSVEVRRGRLNRTYHPVAEFGTPVFGEFPGDDIGFWYPDWQVNSEWRLLTGVSNITLTQSFDNNGVTGASIEMDNIFLESATGAAGILYHIVEQGYYSPLRGYVAPRRPNPGITETPFFNLLPNAQIRVRQGYGEDEMLTTFLGLIDDVETDSVPNKITITARDFGGVLVDEKFFGWAKDIILPSPVIFANRSVAENTKLVGADAQASSTSGGFTADQVITEGSGAWHSAVRDTPDDTEWIEISVRKGRFAEILVGSEFDGMEMFIGVKASPYDDGVASTTTVPTFNGTHMDATTDDDGWWNPYGQTVPGGNGGWAYFAKVDATQSGVARYIGLGGEFLIGTNSVFRIGFRNLGQVNGGYRAGVTYYQAKQRSLTSDAIAGRFVVIDDVADIIRCCLRWAGFKNWEVENTGTDLGFPGQYNADSSMSFMDVINTFKDVAGYTFFIGEPRDDDDDQDLGWPIFRNNRVMEDYTAKTEYIDDRLLLTDAKVTLSNADDHCIIRCRGAARSQGQGGVTINDDSVERVMYAYIPPWANEQAGKQAGVLKPINHLDNLFTRLSDCQFGCYLIALQIALLKYVAIIDLPANPGIGLDTLQSIVERNQGLNSRLYVSNRTSTMTVGSSGSWVVEIGGSLVDTPECVGVLKDYATAAKDLDRGKRNPWLRKRQGKLLNYGYQTGGLKPGQSIN